MGILNLFKKKFPSLLTFGNYGQPKWATNKDEDYIREGFNKIVWVYVCATLISSNVSRVKWELWRVGKGENTKDKQIYDHPLLKLVNGNINEHFSSKDFFELWSLSLALQGKFYAMLNSPVYPTKVYPLYSHKMKPIPDKSNFVRGFEYEINGQRITYKNDVILWSKFNDPLDYYEGMSPIKAGARTIDTENKTVDWNKSAMDNQGVLPGVLQVENPSPTLIDEVRNEWRKRYAGPNNARVPLILDSTRANYVSFGMSQADMDFIEQKLNNRIEICALFKVPPQVAGDTSSQTFSNYEQAERSFWEHCLIPEYLDRIQNDLNLYFASRYGDNLELRYSLDNISVLHESIESKMRSATEGYTKGILKLNEARYLVDHDEVEDGDKFFELQKPFDSENDTDKEDDKKKVNLKTLSDNEKIWRDAEKKRGQYIVKVDKIFSEIFSQEKEKVTSAIRKGDDFKKVLETDKKKLVLQQIHNLIVEDFGSETYLRLVKQKEEPIFFLTDEVKAYIKKVTATKIKDIDSTTVEQIQQRIMLGEQEGFSIYKIAKLIEELYLEQIIPNRSKLIARTEVNGASNFGSFIGAKKSNDDYDLGIKKIWIPTFDGRVRPTHLEAGKHKPIEMDERFKVGNSELMYPADYEGSAEETINCRCAIGYVD